MDPKQSETSDQDSLRAGHHDLPPVQNARRRRRRRGAWLVAVGSVLIMVALGAALVFARLLAGPIELDGLRERVALAIERQVGAGVDVDVARASLELTERGLTLHVRDVLLVGADRAPLLAAPEAFLTFDPLRLLAFEFVPNLIELSGVRLDVTIAPDGALGFGGDPRIASAMTGGSAETAPPTGTPLERLASVVERLSTMAAIGAVSVTESRLLVRDRRDGSERLFHGVSIRLGADSQGSTLLIAARRDGRSLSARFSTRAGPDGGRVVDVSIDGVAAVDLPLPAMLPMAGLADVPLSLRGNAGLDAAGRILGLDAEIESHNGAVPIGTEAEMRLRFDLLRSAIAWRATEPDEAAVSVAWRDGATHLAVAGRLSRRADGRVGFTGEGRNLALADGDSTVAIERLQLLASHDPAADRVTIEQLTLTGPETRIALAADLVGFSGTPAVAINLAASRMPIRTALRYWPPVSAPLARRFFQRHVPAGTLDSLTIRVAMAEDVFADALAMRPLPAESFKASFEISNGRLRLDGGLPGLSGLTLAGTVDARTAEARIIAGAIDAPGDRRLPIGEGQVTLTGLETFTPEARIQARLQGPAEVVTAILAMPGLRRGASRPDLTGVRGTFDGRLALQFPLIDTLDASQIAVTGQASLSGGAIDVVPARERLEAVALQLVLDRGRLTARGEARLQGLPVTIEARADADGRNAEATLTTVLDEATRLRRGIGRAGQITGPTPVRIMAALEDRDDPSVRIDMDLTRAAVDGLLPGLSKPAGRPGRLTFEVEPRADGSRLDDLVLSAGTVQLRGSVDLASDGSLTAARFSQFRLSPGDTVTASIERQGGSGRVTIRGSNFDLRPFLRQEWGEGGDVDLDLRTTLLSGFNGEVLTSAELRLEARGGQPRQLTLTGRLNGAKVSARGATRGREPLQVQVDIDDAGAFLRFLDIYGRMRGGRIDGAIALAAGQRASGILLIRDFALRNEPALRNLIASAPQGTQVRSPGADDVPFTKMRLEFSRAGSETSVREIVIFGPQIGITMAGSFDQRRDRINMSGTFVPAFGLNNIFSQVPLVGDILGGGRNQGLLGVTFALTGRAAQPTVQVNPLSAVAPGIFRRIFEFRNDNSPPPAEAPIPPAGAN